MSTKYTKRHEIIIIKSSYGGGQGGRFFQKESPLAAGGKGNGY